MLNANLQTELSGSRRKETGLYLNSERSVSPVPGFFFFIFLFYFISLLSHFPLHFSFYRANSLLARRDTMLSTFWMDSGG